MQWNDINCRLQLLCLHNHKHNLFIRVYIQYDSKMLSIMHYYKQNISEFRCLPYWKCLSLLFDWLFSGGLEILQPVECAVSIFPFNVGAVLNTVLNFPVSLHIVFSPFIKAVAVLLAPLTCKAPSHQFFGSQGQEIISPTPSVLVGIYVHGDFNLIQRLRCPTQIVLAKGELPRVCTLL